MHVHVYEARRDVRIAGVDDVFAFFRFQKLADLDHNAVADAYVQYRVDPRNRIDDSSPGDENVTPPVPVRR